jgi:type IV pilus assembly protein PilE
MLRIFPKCLPKNGLNADGFTLIELMIVVAIIGILTSIAYPSYMSSVQKSKRTGAKVAVMEIAQAQERYFSVNMQYAYNLTALQASGGAGLGDVDDYTITVAGEKSDSTTCASGEVCVTYTVTAVPKTTSPQNNDSSCKKFTLTHTGIQAAEDGSAADTSGICW